MEDEMTGTAENGPKTALNSPSGGVLGRDEWVNQARQLFGQDPRDWRFVCPVCGTTQSARDFEAHTELERDQIQRVIGFSCIGRWVQGGCEHQKGGSEPSEGARRRHLVGCDYAGGGLFKLNPVHVTHEGNIHRVFAFDREPAAGERAQ